MSWHYLQGQEEASWAESSLDGAPSALSRLSPMHARCSSPDNATDISLGSQSGMTSVPSTATHGAGPLTSSAVGFHAKTSRRRGKALASKASAPDSGLSSLASLARFDRDTCLWKTPQCSLLADSDVFSETWPRWGTMQGGECWALSTPVRHIEESESGSWPTPRKQMSRKCIVRDVEKGHKSNLEEVVACLDPGAIGGSLNPPWVEWLMGWPIGWTDLRPLETDRFQQWFDLHGRR
jgi:hypothetical protein